MGTRNCSDRTIKTRLKRLARLTRLFSATSATALLRLLLGTTRINLAPRLRIPISPAHIAKLVCAQRARHVVASAVPRDIRRTLLASHRRRLDQCRAGRVDLARARRIHVCKLAVPSATKTLFARALSVVILVARVAKHHIQGFRCAHPVHDAPRDLLFGLLLLVGVHPTHQVVHLNHPKTSRLNALHSLAPLWHLVLRINRLRQVSGRARHAQRVHVVAPIAKGSDLDFVATHRAQHRCRMVFLPDTRSVYTSGRGPHRLGCKLSSGWEYNPDETCSTLQSRGDIVRTGIIIRLRSAPLHTP
jgi:hypothetical protein